MFHNILVAIDPSPARHSALRLAGDMARLTEAKVNVLHIAASAASLAAVVPLEDDAEAKAVLDEAVAELRERGVTAEGTVTQALTTMIAPTISATAEEVGADLIVVSPHHRGSVEAFFHPRVSDAVAHASHVAVLLAPEELDADHA
ncbi:universal stress protein [Streptomyces gibsoniae]|uniref:Universal stress protein n=1 Tax=Streptomyces gibsoniae TaxID=3075529 RepID=A0ABU2U7T1_9ACTN|nr:universal stress protein [Streptomyces sp. DSM 41699]MDT0469277.1 universal stress protein [Streptomyces sp. DSM 41699]